MDSKIVNATPDIKKTVNDNLIKQLSGADLNLLGGAHPDDLRNLTAMGWAKEIEVPDAPDASDITYAISLELVPSKDNYPIDKIENDYAALIKKHQSKVIEIVKSSLYGFNIKEYQITGNLFEGIIVPNDKLVGILEPIEEYLEDNYDNGAVDGWMEGDICTEDDIELFINLKSVKNCLDESEPEEEKSDNPRSVKKLHSISFECKETITPKKPQPSSSTRKSKSCFNIITNIKKKIINKHLKKNIKNISIDILKDFLTEEQFALGKKSITGTLTQTEREKIKEWLFGNEIDNCEATAQFTTQLIDRSEDSIVRLQKIGSLLDIFLLVALGVLFVSFVYLIYFL